MIRLTLALILAAAPAIAQDARRPAALQSLLDYHLAACTGQGGTLIVPPDAVITTDLNGDSQPDAILDSARLTCSTVPAMFCAEGVGCELNVFVGTAQHSLVVLHWTLDQTSPRPTLITTTSALITGLPKDQTARLGWDDATAALQMLANPN